MALSGDLPLVAGVRFDQSFSINESGNLVADSDLKVRAIQVVKGTVFEVLHLLGHRKSDLEELLVDNVLLATEKTNEKIKNLPKPGPGAFLVEEKGCLHGVVVDESGSTRLIGIVNEVVSTKSQNNLVLIQGQESLRFCNAEESGFALSPTSTVCSVTNNGFLLIQPQINITDDSKLILALENSYVAVEECQIKLIEIKEQLKLGAFESQKTLLQNGKCAFLNAGACVRKEDSFELFARGCSIVPLGFVGKLAGLMKIQVEANAEGKPLEGEIVEENENYQFILKNFLTGGEESDMISESFEFDSIEEVDSFS